MPKLTADDKAARRANLLGAALRCFARRGYHQTTIDDIAAEAGVSKGAPYVYFPSKEALFEALYDAWDCGVAARVEAALAALDQRSRQSPRRALEALLRAVGQQVREEPDTCRVLMEARTLAPHAPRLAQRARAALADAQARIERLVRAGVARGEWPAGTDPALQARLLLAAVHGLMAEWHLAPGSFSWDAAAAALAGASWAPLPAATGPRRPASRQAVASA
jgi:AcrR family transcriptional regulator